MSAVDDLAQSFCRDREHDSVTWAGAACSDCREAAEDACEKLIADGWRIARTVGSTLGPGLFRIVDEWRPVSGDQEGTAG